MDAEERASGTSAGRRGLARRRASARRRAAAAMDDSMVSRGGGEVSFGLNGSVVTCGERELLVPDELHGRTDEPARNPLEEFQVYSKLKRAKFFEARPDTVHFSGFVLGHRHQKVVQIVNVSHLTKRLHVMPCQTPYFTVHFDKKGKIAPGMAEELLIEFNPDEWRYYHDCIRVHLEEQNLLIPIHAYPTVAPRQGVSIQGSSLVLPSHDSDRNGVYFPSRIDFGYCRLSERFEKRIPIRNAVPMEFEFQFSVVDAHEDIEIEPLIGKVPPHGEVWITLSYTPSKMGTAEMKADLNISQFGFKAQRVVIMGSTMAGSTRKSTLNTLTHHLQSTGQLAREASLENYKAVHEPGDGRINLTIVHDEAKGFKDKIEQARLTRRPGEPIVIHQPRHPSPEPATEIGGVMIPQDLRTRSSVQKVLNQVTGKLSWKELKRQMAETGELPPEEEETDPKAKANESITWYETKRMQPGGFLDIEEEYGEGGRLQVLEFRYSSEVRMREEYDKAKEVKFFPAIGDDPTTEEERKHVLQRRLVRERACAMQEREIMRVQTGTVADQTLKVSHEVGRLVDVASKVTLDPYLNDAWTVRKEITAQFRAHMHTLIVRNRVARRMEAVAHKLQLGGGVGGNASQLVDTLLAAPPPSAAGGSRDKKEGKMARERVVECTFPVYRDGNFRDREAVPVVDIEPMQDWDFLALKVPATHKLMGYAKAELPAVPSYIPLELDRSYRRGAATEQGIRGPRGQFEPDKPAVPADGEAATAAQDEASQATPAAPTPPSVVMPWVFKMTPDSLCHPTPAAPMAAPAATRPGMAHDTARDAAPREFVPVGAGGRSACRALDPKNHSLEGRAKGKCIVYNSPALEAETAPDFSLRVFPRLVGDADLDGALPGPTGALARALNPDARLQRVDAAVFGPIIEGELVAEPEAPGFNTVRAMRPAIAPLLSTKWLARRELPKILWAGLPATMTGPDAEDEQSDGEEADAATDPDYVPEPPVVIAPPSQASVRKEFNIPRLSADGTLLAPAAEEGADADGSDEAAATAAAEEDEQDPMKDFVVPLNARTMHEKELEAEVVARRRGQEARLPELVHQLNALIHDPLNKLPVEPSHFQAPVLQWLVRDASG